MDERLSRIGEKARKQEGCGDRGGFVLVAVISIMVLLALVAVGMLSLASVQVRESSKVRYDAQARANARLALMLALGELQKTLGPDQRVSAPAGVLDSGSGSASTLEHPHWTAAWRSTRADGSSHWVRDDAKGGLRDLRVSEGWNRESEVLSYLVSGNEGGRAVRKHKLLDAKGENGFPLSQIEVVGHGSVSGGPWERVRVPLVPTESGSSSKGNYAYWVGDLGARANVATRNPYEGAPLAPQAVAQGGYHQLLASQESDSAMVGAGEEQEGEAIAEAVKGKLVDRAQVDLLPGGGGAKWLKRHFHDLTVASQGVLSNVREGGLKKDLTAYLESDGEVETLVANGVTHSPGLSDADNLVGPRNLEHANSRGLVWEETRHRESAPRFGLLRDWKQVGEGVSLAHGATPAILPKPEESPNAILEDPVFTSSNYAPASIGSFDRSNLSPVLVEASLFWNFSNYRTGGNGSYGRYNVRRHTYPRVVLWNPYSVELEVEPLMVMIQSNGRHETLLECQGWFGRFTYETVWWNDGRADNFSFPPGSPVEGMSFNEPYIGSMVFSVPATKMAPGECLVFSAANGREYDYQNLANNELSCTKGPDVGRGFWHSNQYVRPDGSTVSVTYYVTRFWLRPSKGGRNAVRNQAEDQRVIIKPRGTASQITFPDFDKLPQLSYTSCSLQYGAGRELRLSTDLDLPVEITARSDPKPTIIPDVRMREGIRLRWFMEHESNLGASGKVNEAHFEEGFLANWNLRGAYALRSPYENIAGSIEGDGSSGGPWYFGAYTRDLFDDDVAWGGDQEPVLKNGRYHGNPFGTPQEGQGRRHVLFDVPRAGVGVVSLGQFQHLKLSEFIWHPSYAVANSLVDPRLGNEGMAGTSPLLSAPDERKGGWVPTAIGWSNDGQRAEGPDEWARFGRAMFQDYPESENLVYDLSYEVNHSLWDPFFLSSGDSHQKSAFFRTGEALPNGRMVAAPSPRIPLTEERLNDYHHAAAHLMVDGAFNVNSTSVEAWKAVLGATRNIGRGSEGATVFSRLLNPSEGEWKSGDDVESARAWAGFRSLSKAEVQRLAEEIVVQVRDRGPFLSVADFVNRRLSTGEEGKSGALQAAIEAAGLNRDFHNSTKLGLRNEYSLGNYSHPDNIEDSTRIEQTLKPASKAWGATTYLTQGDLLQVLGPMIAVRSDTFVIRSYGEALDGEGVVKARSWCEAVVQRVPDPVEPDASGLDSRWQGTTRDFGRRFVVKSFRWLHPDEV